MSKIAREVAVQDFERWLTFKKVKEKKRIESKAQEDELISAIEDGVLSVQDDCTLVLKLDSPIMADGKPSIDELKFKPRINVGELNQKLRGVNSSSPDDRIVGYVSALTNNSMGIIQKLDTEDYRIATAVVMYFL